MKAHFPILLSVCIAAMTCQAEDITLQDDRVLQDIRILDVGSDYLRISHSSGISNVKAADLPQDLQVKYKLTAEEVAARKQEAQQRQNEKWQKQRDSLSNAEKHPRYLKPREITDIVAVNTRMTSLEAEAAAARWNLSEARRVGDKEMSDLYVQALAAIQPQLAAHVAQKQKDADELKKKYEEENVDLKIQLARYEAMLQGKLQENERLADSVERLENKTDRTIVTPWPTGWTNWNRPDIIVVNPSRPSRPSVRPPVRPIPKPNVILDKTSRPSVSPNMGNPVRVPSGTATPPSVSPRPSAPSPSSPAPSPVRSTSPGSISRTR